MVVALAGAWAAAFALALRCVTESVMDPYYYWPTLAFALVAAVVSTESWRFAATIAAAIVATVISQWHLAWALWWILNTIGLIVVLFCAIPFHVVEVRTRSATTARAGVRTGRPRSAQRGIATSRKRPVTS